MKVLVTGSNGFIGKNIVTQLAVRDGFELLSYSRQSGEEDLERAIASADAICHMAGVNRPDDIAEFARVNTEFTRRVCAIAERSSRPIRILFPSSMHVERHNPYGDSKLAAEQVLLGYAERTGAPIHIFRLPHVVGKWCRPNYNSVVATFCHNIARDLPIDVIDPDFPLRLVYVDDLVDMFARLMTGEITEGPYCEARPAYPITVGELADQLRAFRAGRTALTSGPVGTGITRVLYATYTSYLPPADFAYGVPAHADARGVFVEMLKTGDSGQFSFFTAHPGVTRGGHYHHSKTEKFLVIKGRARFRFRHVLSGERHELQVSGEQPQIVEMVPGWAHDVTNVGNDELIVMLWANEVFDRDRPDTYASSPVSS